MIIISSASQAAWTLQQCETYTSYRDDFSTQMCRDEGWPFNSLTSCSRVWRMGARK